MKRSGEVMSGENARTAGSRQKRVQRLKKCIILMLLLFSLTPAVMCVFLFFKLQGVSGKMEELAARVEFVAGENAAQQALTQELMQKMLTTGGGSQGQNVAGRELPGYELELPDNFNGTDSFRETEEGQEVYDTGDAAPETPVIHKVYLTFDDGPSTNTEKILDILDEYDVKATFFVVGKENDWAKKALVDIVERGHTLGMHSYNHRYTDIYSSVENFAEDFVKLRGYLEDVTGVISNVYRFPGGSSNSISDLDMHEFAEYLESWNVRFYDWNAASGDGGQKLLTVGELVKNSLAGIEGRETTIILLHDAVSKPSTVEALPTIIESILAMENTVILPITEETELIQHIHMDQNE